MLVGQAGPVNDSSTPFLTLSTGQPSMAGTMLVCCLGYAGSASQPRMPYGWNLVASASTNTAPQGSAWVFAYFNNPGGLASVDVSFTGGHLAGLVAEFDSRQLATSYGQHPAGDLPAGLLSADQSGSLASSPASPFSIATAGSLAANSELAVACSLANFSAGTPVIYSACASNAASGSTTLQVTVTQTTTAGDAIAVWVTSNGNNIGSNAVTDSQGNTYTQASTTVVQGALNGAWYVALNTTQLASGTDWIKLTCTSTSGAKTLQAVGSSNIVTASAVDVTPTPTTGSSTSPSITSGTLAQSSELVLAGLVTGSAAGTPAWNSPFSALGSSQQQGANQIASVSTDIVSATSSVTASATITSTTWGAVLLSLKASSGVATAFSPGAGFTQAGAWNQNASQSAHMAADYQLDTGASYGATVTDAMTLSLTGSGHQVGCIATFIAPTFTTSWAGPTGVAVPAP
jgi:hypothetical protein